MRRAAFFPLLVALALQAAPPVLLLSADGLGADQFTSRSMPKLWALSEQGRRGQGLPPFPATTFNGHVTMATGCWPEHHGVVANGYVDPATKALVPVASRAEDVQREPLWAAATRSGIRTAVFQWVGATGPWEGVSPWRLEVFRLGRPDSEALAFSEAALRDGAGLVMTYLSGTDEEGHLKGPRSAETATKLRQMDDELAPWLQRMLAAHPGLKVILAADHGMAPMRRRIHLPSLLDGIGCDLLTHGGSAYVYLQHPQDAEKALSRLRRAGLRAWRRDEVPGRLHLAGNDRVGDLVILAREGQWLSKARSSREEAEELHGRRGAHAYTADTRTMRTWLVVLGAGHGSLGPVALWDLAPTMASWLDIQWLRPPDGSPVPVLVGSH
ncbi:MAG: alkaline phosphatase family protein [Geothrix sp.]|uniref:alkaline phosphatase family protein n=1 Tax=Geothrix sp. TaxID=1962974 RepID=UPI0017DA84F8|nr:nucleotide pyrophosphatase/phosphodiesterase family protein [Geothrix sp.]NWJ39832.1 alkaline phosphatase family protein [Geothrix sp.]WIL22155.1 MAG: alkaline phosphatase family protein [Geothrix sp.]